VKTITGKPIFLERRIKLYDECIQDIIPLTKKYFNSWHSHDRFGQLGEDFIVPNAIYTYPYGRIDIKVIKTVSIEIGEHLPPVFLDITKLSVDKCYITENTYNVVEILINSRLAGYYLLDINTLVLSDWTHDKSCIKIFNIVWPSLLMELNLQILNIENQKYVPNEILVGCDPEFELIDKNHVINAGSDLNEDDINVDGEIGLDGSGDQIELRPNPGTPIRVTQNIRKLIKEFSEKYDYDLCDEGHEYPLGGHIHVGIERKWRPDSGLIELLDDFIGRPTIELSGEAREHYKKLSEVRSQPHGFEYRSAPSAIFHNPAIACICMKLAKNLTQKYLNEEVLQYNGIPTIEQYITIGGLSKQQAKYFKSFCSNYIPTRSIIATWKVSKKEKKESTKINLVTVLFQDTWDPICKEYITKHINRKLKDVITSPIIIKLYGIGERRGHNLCTIRTGYTTVCNETIVRPLWQSDTHTLNIGVSYDRRTLVGFSELFGSSLVESIKDVIIANNFGRL
jgi:hypothetical protein